MDRPGVDVVVPFAGSDPELEELAGRLAAMRLGPADSVVVVDNRPLPRRGSSAEWSAKLPLSADSVRVIRSPARQTPPYARNQGAKEGDAEWILFIDADVEAPPDLLDRYFDAPAADHTAVLVGGIIDQGPGEGNRQRLAPRYRFLHRAMSQDVTMSKGRWSFAQTANCGVRRSAFEAVGGFNDEIFNGEDADLCYRLQGAGWGMERREAAALVHRSRGTVRELLGQLATHGAAAEWLNRRYPGSFPPRPLLGMCLWTARSLRAGVAAAARGDRDAAILGFLDPLTGWAFEWGRAFRPNGPRVGRFQSRTWSTERSLEARGSSASVWRRCYADAARWPEWNSQIASARLEGPFEVGSVAKIKFRTGLRMRFRLVEVEHERAFTDEAHLPLARMGHKHLIEPTANGVRLTNRIYIRGPLARLWARVLGRRAEAELPKAQRRIVEIARAS